VLRGGLGERRGLDEQGRVGDDGDGLSGDSDAVFEFFFKFEVERSKSRWRRKQLWLSKPWGRKGKSSRVLLRLSRFLVFLPFLSTGGKSSKDTKRADIENKLTGTRPRISRPSA